MQYFNKLPFFYSLIPQRTNALRLLKKHHNQNLLFKEKPFKKNLYLILSLFVWPVFSLFLLLKELCKNGRQVKEKFGKSIFSQFFELLYFVNIHLITPVDYYYFGFFKAEMKKDASFYLKEKPSLRIFNYLNRNHDLNLLNDKFKFFEYCKKKQIPTPHVIAIFSKGDLKYFDGFNDLPKTDLIFKLRSGLGTRGFMRWEYIGNNFYKLTNTKKNFTKENLIDFIKTKSLQKDYIVQPRLYDHDEIKELSNGSLSTVRMITAINNDKKIIELTSMFNIPTQNSPLNNLKDGAIACPVDSETGQLKEGFTSEIGSPLYEANPFNGSKLKGKRLPDWEECKSIAINAHSKIGNIPFIGWDICCTNDDWMILEGNHGIALNFHQLPPNQPLGKTEFINILKDHLIKETLNE